MLEDRTGKSLNSHPQKELKSRDRKDIPCLSPTAGLDRTEEPPACPGYDAPQVPPVCPGFGVHHVLCLFVASQAAAKEVPSLEPGPTSVSVFGH